MEIKEPVIIMGVERSGTTLVYSNLANHPEFYWISRLDSIMPGLPTLSCLIRRVIQSIWFDETYIAVPKAISKTKGLLPHLECVPPWKNIFKWGNEDNYLIENDYFSERDLTQKIRQSVKTVMSKRLT